MILIFGGTTEGRKTAKVCDQAGSSFFYATRGNLQKMDIANGKLVTGGLDKSEMIAFCKENNIKLIIDAAHPFAENLHQNIKEASEELKLPVIRYERNYAKRSKNAMWFDSYAEMTDFLLRNDYNKILALTGVNTLAKFKNLWTERFCWFRILDRDASRNIAQKIGFPKEQLLYYKKDEDEKTLFKKLNPQVILTKESGESGGFSGKLTAAKELKIPLLVVKRPPLSENFITVFGEHGLRKEIERLAKGFFKLKTGFTTGTCATAATKAALTTYFTHEKEEKVSITLPNGEWIFIPIADTQINKDEVTAIVIKDAGDDPDVTNGTRICSTVKLNANHRGIHYLQGEGVGRITLPGVGLEIGEPAINKTPRLMIKREVFKVLRHHQEKLPNRRLNIGVDVTISVPDGRELASQTFNPKIGIVDGISIIGTSGIVKPFSSEAFVAAIHREMQVAKALGATHIVINSGAKSEAYVKARYPHLPSQAFIHYGNFIGETLKVANKIGLEKVSLGIMIGKAVKLAEGKLLQKCKDVCQPVLTNTPLEVLLMDNSGEIVELK